MKHIETVGKFCICKDSKGFFWAIREEWIDSKGKLTRQEAEDALRKAGMTF